MFKFKRFVTESAEANEEKLTHLEHAEDHVINAGHEGFSHAYNNLMDVHNKLLGKQNDTKVTMKYDGSPSVIFGRNPDNGKFFVASKSAFNKNPKINYTPEDIEANHGHAPGLVAKLKAALLHLPKVAPPHGVYQGDIMHTPEDVHSDGNGVSFTPNTITYSAPNGSPQAKKVRNSKIGVAVHTAYNGGSLAGMKAEYAPDLDHFNSHPDVHMISTQHPLGKIQYTPKQQAEFKKHIDAASRTFATTPREAHDAVAPHTMAVKTYINSTVRDGSKPSTQGLLAFMHAQKAKAIMSVKTPASQQKKADEHDANIAHVTANAHHFDNILKIHHHLQKAKDALTNALSSQSEFGHTIKGKPAKPEGFVVVRGNRPTKFVDRAEFSRANFAPRGVTESYTGTGVGGGAVRGAGASTGDASPTIINTYIGANIADADTQDNQLKHILKTFHNNYHGKK